MFLATCLLAASVFAAPKVEDVKAAAADGKASVEAKVATAKAKTQVVKKKTATAKEKVQTQAADVKATAADVKTQAAEVKTQAAEAKAQAAEAKAAVVEKAAATENKANEVKAQAVETATAPVVIPSPTPEVKQIPAAEAAPVAIPAAAPAPVTATPAPVVTPTPAPVIIPTPTPVAEPVVEAPVEEAVITEPATTTNRKKNKMIENAVFTVNEIDFDINADFELEAGKVFWTTEDDDNMDNLETWSGEANLAILAETKNFKGKIALAFYPGDLKTDNFHHDMGSAEDYFSLDEAWAFQSKDWFSFKVGRWDNTDKNGDYFGGYIDGYTNGFLSSQDAENQFEFGFVPNENMDFAISFISKAAHLNKGDLRAVFNFHDLPSLELFEIQLGYRSNVFDKVYDTDADIKHNVSMKVRYPIIPEKLTVFGEVALMDLSDDMVVPLTGGIELNFKTVDRVILEAEYVSNRHDHDDFVNFKSKHIKDVLGALYLEKALTDRFSLSAGFHNYGASRDFMLSGNLIGRIN